MKKKLPGKFIPLVVMDMTTLREGAVPFFPFFSQPANILICPPSPHTHTLLKIWELQGSQ